MATEEEQERTYEVKDKRRINADGTLKEDVADEPEAPSATAEEVTEEAGQPEEELKLPPPDIYSVLQFMAGMLAEHAWLFMGLRVAPGQKEPVKDLVQAKLAIDTLVFISDKLHPHITEDDRRAMRDLIGDLQINFVKHGE